MSGDNVFGPWVDGWYVEDVMEAMLKRWVPPALREVERAKGLRALTIPDPVSWAHHNVFTKAMQDATPHIVIVAPGLAGRPTREGDGTYTAPFVIGVGAVVADQRADWASQTAKAYLAAIRLAIMKNRGLEDPLNHVQRTVWEDERYDDVPATSVSDRHIGTAQTVWTVSVRGVATDTPGPIDPPAGTADPGPWPTIDPSKIDIQIDKTPLD